MKTRTLFPLLAGLLVTGCGAPAETSESDVATTSEALVTLTAKLWPQHDVRVCFEPGSAPSAADQQIIRDAIDDTWGRAAHILIGYWGTCKTAQAGIHIAIADSEPTTGTRYGRDLDGIDSGMLLDTTYARYQPTCSASEQARQTCMRHDAIRVFGLALGFQPNASTDPASVLVVTNYDQLRLSPLDVVGVQTAYGRKQDESIVGIGGKCLDVPSLTEGALVRTNYCYDYPTQRFVHASNYLEVGGEYITYPYVQPGLQVDASYGSAATWLMDTAEIRALGDMCLSVRGGSTADWTPVELAACNGSAGQKWNVASSGDLVGLGGKCLRIGYGDGLAIGPCGAERWTFASGGELGSSYQPSYCVTVTSGTPSAGEQPSMATCNGALAQRYYLRGTIRSYGNCLDVRGNDSRALVPVQIYGCSSNREEIFDVYP